MAHASLAVSNVRLIHTRLLEYAILGRETGRGPLARVDRRTLGSSTRAALLWNSPQGPPSEERRTDAAENKEEKRDIDGSDYFICPWGTAHGTLRVVMVEPGKNE